MKLEQNTNLMQRYLILEAVAYAGGQLPPPPTPRYREKVKKVEKRRKNGKKPPKGERNQENSKKKSNRKRKQGNGEKRVRKQRKTVKIQGTFVKFVQFTLIFFQKNFSAINLKILFKSIQKSQENR